jgi:hypothetical protein
MMGIGPGCVAELDQLYKLRHKVSTTIKTDNLFTALQKKVRPESGADQFTANCARLFTTTDIVFDRHSSHDETSFVGTLTMFSFSPKGRNPMELAYTSLINGMDSMKRLVLLFCYG